MTDLIKIWQLLPTENPLVKLSIRLLSFVPSSASIERIFSLMGDTKTKKRNKMKTKKLQDITYIKSDLRRRQAQNGTARRRLKRHFGNVEPNGGGTHRGRIEDEDIVRAAEDSIVSGDKSSSASEDDNDNEAGGSSVDSGASEGPSFSGFAQAACAAADADSDGEDTGEIVEASPSTGPTRNVCYSCISHSGAVDNISFIAGPSLLWPEASNYYRRSV
jgi:hypothetical protein